MGKAWRKLSETLLLVSTVWGALSLAVIAALAIAITCALTLGDKDAEGKPSSEELSYILKRAGLEGLVVERLVNGRKPQRGFSSEKLLTAYEIEVRGLTAKKLDAANDWLPGDAPSPLLRKCRETLLKECGTAPETAWLPEEKTLTSKACMAKLLRAVFEGEEPVAAEIAFALPAERKIFYMKLTQ